MAKQTFSIAFGGYWREPNISGVPSHSGVYCVYTCTHNIEANNLTLHRLIYIGEAGDVNSRLANHEGWDAWKTYLKQGQVLCVSTAPAESASRVRIEAACIKYHQPPSNTEYKDAFPHDETTVTTSGENIFLAPCFTVQRQD
jgi:hypothetical protein